MVVTSLNSLEIEKLLFQPTKNVLLLVDALGNIQFSNSRVEKIFLFKRSYLFNKNISILFSKKYISIVNTYIYRCFNATNFDFSKTYSEILAKRKDDDIFKIGASFKMIRYQRKKFLLIDIKDLSEQTLTKQQEKFLEDKKRMKFISNTSHELRAPLTTILSAAEILEKFKGSFGYEDIQTKNINRIKNSVQHLTKVLNDFLKINRIEEYTKFTTKPVSIKKISETIINTFHHANAKNILIKYEHEGEVVISICEEILTSIINNLLSNAIKYSKENSIVNFSTFVNGNHLTMICKDSGIGIPKEEQKDIFNRYYRASNVKTEQGTGLGLSIIKEYLNKINGEISLESNLNQGTIFHVKIPLI